MKCKGVKMKHIILTLCRCILVLSTILFALDVAMAQSNQSPSQLGEEKYQELKAKGLLPQPGQVPVPTQLRPENIISPDAIERGKGLLIPLEETFTQLQETETPAGVLKPRTLPIKPKKSIIPPGYSRKHIEVKFLDEIDVTLGTGGYPIDRSGKTLKPLTASQILLEATVMAGGRWQRMAAGVSEEKIDRMRMTAEINLRRKIADLNNYFILSVPEGISAEQWLDQLNILSEVEIAIPIPLPVPPPVPPNFQNLQGYINPATDGIDASYAWTLPGGTGTNVTICDLEYSWNLNHQDLPPSIATWIPTGFTASDPYDDNNHGTAVLGELVSLNNGWGTTGLAYGATAVVAPTYYLETEWDLGTAMTFAISNMVPGDVILIEQQFPGPRYTGTPPGTQFGLIPVEWWQSWYNVILTAVGNGIHVVEPAGNGEQNLDDPIYSTGNNGNWPFLPQNNSGAIIVGAGAAPAAFGGTDVDRSRLWFSNYGSRVDLQGWGERVVTTGYGDYYYYEGQNLWYTNFGGTSSASPIVASAVALYESNREAISGSPIGPIAMRWRLESTGSPQQAGAYPISQNIGPRPNLLSAINFPGWIQATPNAGWSARDVHTSVVFDGKMWVTGGWDGSYRNDVWSSTNGVTWDSTARVGTRWSGRFGHTSVVFDGKIWVIGGYAGSYRNDVWSSLDGVNWDSTPRVGPRWQRRYGHTSVVFDNKMWVIGGYDGSGFRNDVWSSSDGVNWDSTPRVGPRWSARYQHTSVVFDDTMWVIGGYDGSYRNDVWSSWDGINWTQATGSAEWSGRYGHTSVVFDNTMWVIGGNDGSYRNDVWSSSDGINWIQATGSAGWSGRFGHTSVVFDNNMWVIGGWDTWISFNDVWYSGTATPQISVNPTIFIITLPRVSTTQTLTIGNSGNANLNYSLSEVPLVTWLSENPTSGTIPPGNDSNVIVSFNYTGLSPGTYQCTLRITSNDPINPTVNVPVQFTIAFIFWVRIESSFPYFIRDGGALVTVSGDKDGISLYAFRGNKSNEFYMFNGDTWAKMCTIPYGTKPTDPLKINKKKIGKGAALCFDNNHTIYATKGNGTRELWKYDILAHTWTQDSFVPVPKVLKGGTSIAYLGGKVYLLAGNQKKTDTANFFVYDVGTNAWSALADLELGPNTKVWKDGSCLALLDDTIYALKGGDKLNFFYAYDISSNTWTASESIPRMDSLYGKWKKLTVKDGGAMCAVDGAIYAIKGGGANVFWKYTTTEGWTRLESIPRLHKKSVPKTGAALAYANSKVWLLKGNNTPEFWCYTPSSMSNVKAQMSKPILLSGVMAEPTNIYPFMLYQNSPNPFNSQTAIRYSIPRECNVSLSIYDITGKLVKTLMNETMNPGVYTISWNGNDNDGRKVGQGVYFYILKTTDEEMQKKMLMLR